MGTHLDKNGYYIWAKWVPISHASGYPFLDYIVLFGTKYSGDIKMTDHYKDQICEYQHISISARNILCAAKNTDMLCLQAQNADEMLIANVKSRFVAKALLYHCNSVAIQLQRQ